MPVAAGYSVESHSAESQGSALLDLFHSGDSVALQRHHSLIGALLMHVFAVNPSQTDVPKQRSKSKAHSSHGVTRLRLTWRVPIGAGGAAAAGPGRLQGADVADAHGQQHPRRHLLCRPRQSLWRPVECRRPEEIHRQSHRCSRGRTQSRHQVDKRGWIWAEKHAICLSKSCLHASW